MEREAIDLNEDIPIEYQRWHCGHMEEEEIELTIPYQRLVHITPLAATPAHVPIAPIPASIQHQNTCENPILDYRIETKTTLFQILAIPRFVPNKVRKRTIALYSHNKLITSESFVAKIKEKEDREAALQLALQEKKKVKQEESYKKKKEKEGKQIDDMVKKWIREIEKKGNFSD